MSKQLDNLNDELYYAAEECLPFIERHPFGKNLAHRMRNILQKIVRAKLDAQKQQQIPKE